MAKQIMKDAEERRRLDLELDAKIAECLDCIELRAEIARLRVEIERLRRDLSDIMHDPHIPSWVRIFAADALGEKIDG